jgi:DNA polymerase III alpha subunit
MIDIALRSEFSFRRCFGHLEKLVQDSSTAIGVADSNNTFGHVRLQSACQEAGIKPLFGVRLMVTPPRKEKEKAWGPECIFIARNEAGLKEIYDLVSLAYMNFYYHPYVTYRDVAVRCNNTIMISHIVIPGTDYLALNHLTPMISIEKAHELNIPHVATNHNHYPEPTDRDVYELLVGDRFRDTQTYPQHILDEEQWKFNFRHLSDSYLNDAILRTDDIASSCEHFSLPVAKRVRYEGHETLENLCAVGAKRRGVIMNETYTDRLEHELKLIHEKDYADYFLIVAEMVSVAKETMLVGPSRGSSAGSLVSFLVGITEVDPIKYGLLFERFIDVNRLDLPDIDIDFPDWKRDRVIKRLIGIYGVNNVAHLGTISQLKPKSAMSEFAASLKISDYEIEATKDAIINRSGGDARASMRTEDTLRNTEPGRALLEKYPQMLLAKEVEGHARHSGIHAAGVIVCNDPLTKFTSVNKRDNVVQIDKRDAEKLNLLKIDCLGLRTLAILEEFCDLTNHDFHYLYTMDLEDPKVLKVFADVRLAGIFQFDGYALRWLTQEMKVTEFEHIVALTALGRPGPIHSGGAGEYVDKFNGVSEVAFLSEHESVVRWTRDTLGTILYQEQVMGIAREYGGMSWSEVSKIRKALGKSLGEEFFNQFWESFRTGTREKGIPDDEAQHVWKNMMTFGSWGFNKSHAVAYAMVSYWTAWAKVTDPLNFAVACMNHAKDKWTAIRLLRELVEYEGIEYIPVDADESKIGWSVHDGKLIGGLTNIYGIGKKNAKKVIDSRETGEKLGRGLMTKLLNPETDFDILFPCRHFWGHFFENPKDNGLDEPPSFIRDVDGKGDHIFIGRMVTQNLRDLNEYAAVVKRGGKRVATNPYKLNVRFEDDTGSVLAFVDRRDYERIGRSVVETGVVEESWYLIAGSIDRDVRYVRIRGIVHLGKGKK